MVKTKQRAIDYACVNGVAGDCASGGVTKPVTVKQGSATKQRAAGELGNANGQMRASRSRTNGHAMEGLPPTSARRGRKRGGDNRSANDVSCAPASSNGHARTDLAPATYMRDQAGGGARSDDEIRFAASKIKGRSRIDLKPNPEVSGQAAGGGSTYANDGSHSACRELQELQRRKVASLKSRIMIDNQLAAMVAIELGYSNAMEEADRKAKRAEAVKLIEAIDSGDADPRDAVASRVAGIVSSTRIARNGFDAYLKGIEKEMERLAKSLPVAKWVKSVRGFGMLNLATIVGECGDLSLYANPAKAWKRLGLAPFQGKMPSTWRSKGGLSAEQWTEIGYSPRRRSLMYVVSECIVKQNDGEYRARYDEAKATFQAADPERSKGHCHNHGMLCAVKRLVRDLWREWRAAP